MLESLKQLFIAFLISLILCPPSMVHAGGITPDAAAPAGNQATMDSAPNGVDVINIAAPNGNGMSHNMFTDFNVGTQGVIINNGVAPGVSQLGGALAPNPNFSGTAASTILNEVTGTGRTSINGHTEIFGQAANYILSNPNGISINGGGFINTPKATLTTGVPQFSGNTFLGLDVRGGDILVHGSGINTNNIDTFELVTRVATINADIHAKSLSVITGQNRHNPVTGTTTPLASDGTPAPAISIDSSALGGMYAGRIKLVGTEAGVGVNTRGLVQSTEHLEMTADGKIRITTKVSSADSLALTSQDSIDISGTVKAAGTATLTAPTVTVAKAAPTDAALVNADKIEINAGTLDNQRLIAADTETSVTATNLTNTGTIYSGGSAVFRIGDTLYNNRGVILAKGDMVMEGTAVGQKMATLQNDSAVIESLDGSLTIRAATLNNNNLDFQLVEGATELSSREGVYQGGDDNWKTYVLFEHYVGRAYAGPAGWTAWPMMNSYIGLDPSQNSISSEDMLIHIAEVEQKLIEDPNYLTATGKSHLPIIKNLIAQGIQYFIATSGQTNGVIFHERVTQDSVTGQDKGSLMAAQGDILIEAGTATNNVSAISSATGDITIAADSFANVGREVFERSYVTWGRAAFHSHASPSIQYKGGGTETHLKPIDHVYGSIDAGNKVTITGGTVTNGVTERNGIFSPPDPTEQKRKVTTVTDETSTLPANGLFNLNTNPAQNYVIETDPAIANLDAAFGSDYMMQRLGMNPHDEANKREGDAFYETRRVREQIHTLAARRFLDDARTTDNEQFKSLMDNAVELKDDLQLTPGIALTREQVASLTKDIVWLEKKIVMGQEVLVPVVYLGSNSIGKIAQGGSVIVGRDVAVDTTGDTSNAGLIQSETQVAVTADNFFNSGTVSGQTVTAEATDSIRNFGGNIKADDITLKAAKDVVIAADMVTFTKQETTDTQVAKAGHIDAANSLSIESGNDIGIIGSKVSSGGDATLKAGGNVAVSTVQTETKASMAGSGYSSRTNITTHKGGTLETGGELTVEAGKDIAVHGSEVTAQGDATLKAGGNVAVTAATNEIDLYWHSEKSSGGFSGGSKSITSEQRAQTNVASTIESGGNLHVEAGSDGPADVIIQGSTLKAAQDAAVKASRDIQATPNQVQNYQKFEETRSGFMDAKSMNMSEKDTTTNTRPVIEAGGKAALTAKEDVVLQSATIKSGDTTEITAEDGKVAMLVSKDKTYEHTVKTDMGFLTWSSEDKGKIDETVLHTIIESGGALTITTPKGIVVEFKDSTGDVRKDAALLANVEGLEWMGDLLERDDVDWQAVQEVHDQWSKSDGGLGAGGMLIVSIIASAVTAGAASSLALTTMGLQVAANGAIVTAAGTAATTAQLAMHAALTAAFTSVGTQVVTAVADAAAGGDLGTNLGNIVSTDGLRSLAATMVLAGTLNAGATTKSFAEMGKAGEYMATAAVQTATDSIIGGKDLQESFLSAVGSAFGRYSAGEIDASALDAQMKIILHGAAGAAGAAATGGDPYAGAMGAIVAELAAPAIDQALFEGIGEDGGSGTTEGKTILAGSQIASVLASSLAGVDSNDAVAAGRNAVMNNYLMPQEKKELVEKLEACGDDAACKGKVQDPYADISLERDKEFGLAATLCATTTDCTSLMKKHWNLRMELTKEGIEYFQTHLDEFVKLPDNKSVFHTVITDPETGTPIKIWDSNGSTKYVHPIYGYEVIVKVNGEIDTNAINIGTYNFYNEGNGNPLISSTKNHILYDIAPYYLLGNNHMDKATLINKLVLSIKGLI